MDTSGAVVYDGAVTQTFDESSSPLRARSGRVLFCTECGDDFIYREPRREPSVV